MARWGEQSAISSAGGSQEKRKAAVRKESAETQEYQIVPTERYEGGQRRQHGGVEFRSQCGKRCGRMA